MFVQCATRIKIKTIFMIFIFIPLFTMLLIEHIYSFLCHYMQIFYSDFSTSFQYYITILSIFYWLILYLLIIWCQLFKINMRDIIFKILKLVLDYQLLLYSSNNHYNQYHSLIFMAGQHCSWCVFQVWKFCPETHFFASCRFTGLMTLLSFISQRFTAAQAGQWEDLVEY